MSDKNVLLMTTEDGASLLELVAGMHISVTRIELNGVTPVAPRSSTRKYRRIKFPRNTVVALGNRPRDEAARLRWEAVKEVLDAAPGKKMRRDELAKELPAVNPAVASGWIGQFLRKGNLSAVE